MARIPKMSEPRAVLQAPVLDAFMTGPAPASVFGVPDLPSANPKPLAAKPQFIAPDDPMLKDLGVLKLAAPPLGADADRRNFEEGLRDHAAALLTALKAMVAFFEVNAALMQETRPEGGVYRSDMRVIRAMYSASKDLRADLCRVGKTFIPNIHQKIDEIVLAAELGLSVNPVPYGADLYHRATKRRFEVKKSVVLEERKATNRRTGKDFVVSARCSFAWPMPAASDVTLALEKRVAAVANFRLAASVENKTLGGAAFFLVVNRFNRPIRAFVLHWPFLRYYFNFHSPGVKAKTAYNMGCMRCHGCRHFHRLEKLQQANDYFMTEYARRPAQNEKQWQGFTGGLRWKHVWETTKAHCARAPEAGPPNYIPYLTTGKDTTATFASYTQLGRGVRDEIRRRRAALETEDAEEQAEEDFYVDAVEQEDVEDPETELHRDAIIREWSYDINYKVGQQHVDWRSCVASSLI